MSEHVVRSTLYGEPNINDVRRNLIREMNRASIYRLEGSYSGGHDEGGLDDDLTCLDKDDRVVVLEVPEGNLALYQAVEDLLSTKFYTWALDCYVTGRVYVDLREKRAWTEGSVEEMQYVDDHDPVDLRW